MRPVLVGTTSAAPVDRGQTVAEIRFKCDALITPQQFPGKIVQKVGEPLDPSKVSESLKRLYATGRFQELRADVEPETAGVKLIFVARAVYFVGVVQVEGAPKILDPNVFADASRLRLGQPLAEEDLVEADKRLVGILVEGGYYQGQVKHSLKRNPDTQQADVIFSITPGPPAKLSQVKFQGRTVVRPAQLSKISNWRPGKQLTATRIERGLFKIHKFYIDHNWLQATASVQKRDYDPKSQTETLLVQVDSGPQVQVRVVGAHLSGSKRRELLPMYRDGVVDDTALAQGERALLDYFQRQGFFWVSVKASRSEQPKTRELDITYQVQLGQPGEFEGYLFRGNHNLSTAELIATITEESSASTHPLNVFSRQLFGRYAETLKTAYNSRGFLEARITTQLQDLSPVRPGHLRAIFDIDEGERTTVRHLEFQGLDLEAQNIIKPQLLTNVGQPYSPARAQKDRDYIAGYLLDHGYTQPNVTWQVSPVRPSHEVDLEYRAELGPAEQIERVIIMGNQHTREGIIRRELTIGKNEPLRQSDLLESQRRLYDLGIFNQVQIGTQDTQSPETRRTVLVNVEEARRWTVGYGGGVEVQRLGSNQPQGQLKASPRLSLEVSRLDVGGRPQTVTLRGRFSDLEKGGALSYLIPHFAAQRDLDLRINGLVDKSRDVLTFSAERQEASINLEKHYSPATLLVGRFSFRHILVDESTLRISPQLIPILSRPARIAMLGGSYVNDHRDNPADATKGSYSLVDSGVAWDRLGSEANFVRFSGQNATYYRLSPHLVFARNTRLQIESRFGTSGKDIPLPERFFMGGSESHRGFSINQAGPRDPETGYPVGGNALFFNSLELRIPLVQNRFGLVLFHDAGNVFSTIRRMRLLKVTQNSPTDFDYTVHAVGLGFRYKTPVGPARFDVGYDLNPPRFRVIDPQTGLVEVRRLSNFQFFVSIGQSF